MWKKDIVLEEVGNITNVASISSQLDVQGMNAEMVAAASIVFVASAYDNGTKSTNESGYWATDMFTYNLERAYNDHLYGDEGDDGELASTLALSSHHVAQLCSFTSSSTYSFSCPLPA